jgi:hypothetical protein
VLQTSHVTQFLQVAHEIGMPFDKLADFEVFDGVAGLPLDSARTNRLLSYSTCPIHVPRHVVVAALKIGPADRVIKLSKGFLQNLIVRNSSKRHNFRH